MRRTMALLGSIALVLAACGNGDDDASTTTTTEATTTTTEVDPPWVSCENPEEGYAIDRPPNWETNDGSVMAPCSLFDPDPITVEPATEIPLDVAVAVTVDPIAADEVMGPDPTEEVLDREDATVDDRRAVRQEVRATGEGFLPVDTRAVRWIVDLDDRTLVAATHDVGEPPYDEAVEVLDAMVATLSFEDPADPDPTTTTTAPTTTTQPEGEGLDPVGDPRTETVQSEDFPGGFGDTALLVDVRESRQDGFHRIVLEFGEGEVPSYRVGYVDPPATEPGSGREVEVAGTDLLELRLEPAARVDLTEDDAPLTYDGPERFDLAGPTVSELVFVGDFESNMGWVVGTEGRPAFAAAFFEDPMRLVVDILDG